MTDNTYTKHTNHKMLKGLLTLMAVLFATVMVLAASASNTYAADDTSIREAHQIAIENKGKYCLFVTSNVVLTPEDIAKWKEDIQNKVEKERREEIEKKVEEEYPEFTPEEVEQEINKRIEAIVDDELRVKVADEILTRSGLYMKRTNCKKASHIKIDLKTWNKKIYKLALIDKQIDDFIASAETVKKGEPYITYMDICISKDKNSSVVPEDSAKLLSKELKVAELLMAAMATKEDAEDPENVCKEENKPAKKEKEKKEPKTPDPKEKEEMLPEMRTIPMADRSGDPLKATLEDGSPVTLEWIDPGSEPDGDKSFWDKIPGGILTPIALLLGLLLLLILLLKRRKQDDSE